MPATTRLSAEVILETAKAKKQAGEFQGDLRALGRTMRKLTTDEEKQRKELGRLKEAYRAGILSARQYGEAVKRLNADKNRAVRETRRLAQEELKLARARRASEAAGFRRRFSRAGGGGLGGLTRGLGIGGRFAGAGPIGLAGAAIGAGIGGVRAVARSAGNLADFGAQAGTIGTDAAGLRGFQAAAARTGVSANAAALGLQRMTRRIAEAAVGSGEAQGALAKLGLDAAELAKMRPEDQFRRIADEIGNVGNQGEQLRIAFKLFDSEGAKLLETLRLGRDELDRYAQKWDEAYGPEAVEQAEFAATAIANLNDNIGLLGQRSANLFTSALGVGTENLNRAAFGDPVGIQTQLANQMMAQRTPFAGASARLMRALGYDVNFDQTPTNQLIQGPTANDRFRTGARSFADIRADDARSRARFSAEQRGAGPSFGPGLMGPAGLVRMAAMQQRALQAEGLQGAITATGQDIAATGARGRQRLSAARSLNQSLRQGLVGQGLTAGSAGLAAFQQQRQAEQRFAGSFRDEAAIAKENTEQLEILNRRLDEYTRRLEELQEGGGIFQGGEAIKSFLGVE